MLARGDAPDHRQGRRSRKHERRRAIHIHDPNVENVIDDGDQVGGLHAVATQLIGREQNLDLPVQRQRPESAEDAGFRRL
jgi:hypothetical protein